MKYKTKAVKINYKGVSIGLKNHAAQDLGRFDYLNDVSRIENWQNNNQGKIFVGGCAILLTNDSAYWTKDGNNCIYEEFALKDKTTILAGQKNWVQGTSPTSVGQSRISGINLKNSYDIRWKDYCDGFKYLTLVI